MSTSDPGNRIDIGHALDHGQWNGFQRWVLALAAMAFLVDGIANQVMGLAVTAIGDDWGLTRKDFAAALAMGLVGVAIGTVIGGISGDRYGRRVGLISSVLFFGVMTVLSAYSSNMTELVIYRTLSGLGLGGAIPNGAALIAEYTPIRRRSVALAMGMVFMPVGGLVSSAAAAYVLPQYGWHTLFLLAGLLTVVVGVIFIFALPESPRFLLRWPTRRHELIKLLGRFGYGFSSEAEFVDGVQVSAQKSPVTMLFGPGSRRDTLGLWVAFFFCLMAGYSMFSWVPAMLSGQGFGLKNASLGLTAFHVGGVLGALVCGWMMGKFGSKISMMLLAGGGVIGAVLLAFMVYGSGKSNALLSIVLIIEGLFISGVHNGMYTIAAFAYPAFIRATGVGAAASVGRIGAILSSFTGVFTLDMFGAPGFCLSIGVMLAITVISCVIVQKHIPRTAAAA